MSTESSVVETLADLLAAHTYLVYEYSDQTRHRCTCGWEGWGPGEHRHHVAEQVAAHTQQAVDAAMEERRSIDAARLADIVQGYADTHRITLREEPGSDVEVITVDGLLEHVGETVAGATETCVCAAGLAHCYAAEHDTTIRQTVDAALGEVERLADSIHGDSGWAHNGGCEGEPDCFACIEEDLRRIVHEVRTRGGEDRG